MSKLPKVTSMGIIDCTQPGHVRFYGWGFDYLCWGAGNTKMEKSLGMAAAIRQILTFVQRNEGWDLGMPIADPDGIPQPISTQDEREAEMETYLLINRLQGNG